MDSENDTVRLRAAESLLRMIGMVGVGGNIGPTSMSEKKVGELYQSPDMAYFKNQFKEFDDIISQLNS